MFGVEDTSVSTMKICKHVPHQFEWKVLDPEELVTVKQKKKSITQRAGDLELSKPPILLRDGDHIGVLVDGSASDDLQTEADRDAAEVFRVQKEQQQKEKAEAQKTKNQYANDNIGVHIRWEEDEEERAL